MKLLTLSLLILFSIYTTAVAEEMPVFPKDRNDTTLETKDFSQEIIINATGDEVVIEADNVQKLPDGKIKATGNVSIIKEGMLMKADKAVLDRETDILDAEGSISVYSQDAYLWGDTCRFNTADNTGTFTNTKGFFKPYMYIHADTLTKTGPLSYTMEDAKFTSCPGENPDWSLNASSAKVDIGGYFRSVNTTIDVKQVPVLYTPYMLYPVKTKRETGLLVPPMGSNSERGMFIAPKLFLNLGVDKDATISTYAFQKGGMIHEGEYRQKFNELNNIYIYGEYSKDNLGLSDKSERYFFYNDTEFTINNNFRIFLESDYVSDFRYNMDLKDFMMSEMTVDREYENDSNRYYHNLRAELDTDYSDIRVKYMEDVKYSGGGLGYKKTELIQAPSISAEKDFYESPKLNFYYYASYDDVRQRERDIKIGVKKESEFTAYTRNHLQAKVYKPINLRIATLTPYYSRYYTEWNNMDIFDGYTAKDDDSGFSTIRTGDDSVVRNTYDVGYSIELNEIFKQYDGFKHSIYNTFSYMQIPRLNETGAPDYIEYDRIGGGQVYTYLFRNYFRAPKWNAKFEIQKSYDASLIEEQWQPYVDRLDFNYGGHLNIAHRHELHHYSTNTDYLHDSINITFDPVTFSVVYSFDKDVVYENTSLTTKIKMELEKFRFEFAAKNSGHNEAPAMQNLISREYVALAVYKSICWEFGLQYSRNDYTTVDGSGDSDVIEHTIMFLITLRGLGELSI